MVLFLKAAGLDMSHAAYKGGAPALTDVVAGQVPTYFANLSEALPHADNPDVRILAVSSPKRTAQLPKIPTVAESGYPGFETLTWNGLLAPARTPRPIIDKIAAQIARELAAMLFELRFQPVEEGQGIGGGAGKSGDHRPIAESPHLPGIRFDDGLAQGDLPVAGDHDRAAAADRQDGGGVNLGPHLLVVA